MLSGAGRYHAVGTAIGNIFPLSECSGIAATVFVGAIVKVGGDPEGHYEPPWPVNHLQMPVLLTYHGTSPTRQPRHISHRPRHVALSPQRLTH
jgi:hypothetical protein